MKFAPLTEKLTTVTHEGQLRSCFMEYAGDLLGAKAWGLDLLDRQYHVIASDLHGVPDTFRDRYQERGREADPISQQMIKHQIPVHNLSVYSPQDWQQSTIYQSLFRIYGLEHGVVAPLMGNGGLIGGIYFMRGPEGPAFHDGDLIQLSSLCLHLSVRLATFRFAVDPALVKSLTPRELDVAELVAQGLSNREIALKLYISRDAVKQTLKRMFRKLDVSARAEMVAKLKA